MSPLPEESFSKFSKSCNKRHYRLFLPKLNPIVRMAHYLKKEATKNQQFIEVTHSSRSKQCNVTFLAKMEQNSRIVQKLLQPGALIDKTGASYNPANLQNKKVFVLYFSAHWCPPCRQFTPILTEQFRIHNSQANSSSMVIFVSGDRSLQQQLEYMQSQGDWPAVPCQSALQM